MQSERRKDIKIELSKIDNPFDTPGKEGETKHVVEVKLESFECESVSKTDLHTPN